MPGGHKIHPLKTLLNFLFFFFDSERISEKDVSISMNIVVWIFINLCIQVCL